ncbi:hypothetical protein CAPTEDRAFT_226177 [Capitella teleta]|uniref:SUEL-type lectin domain-containing protein n=1 Tax=Capitella teleta TaxID=283909 RepID=R7V2K2_CAPTE|nr:hypothetical protein CAPTEDRAFT_226177 [Capitella teleta]|eukprot:ELU12682.1 hypothetical protein CAPTEDRAFT_226177 [Capitella teleta]
MVWGLGCVVFSPRGRSAGVKDFCQSEYFNVSCGIGQVILMEHAFYGRMSGGRCITGTYGNTGCSQDVLPYMHSRCSAQRSCAVYIAEPTLHRMNPCPLDLASYLEADYSCIAVADQARDSDGYTNCRRGHRLELSVSSTAGYVSSESGSCLWTLQAEEGQTIQISLLSFGASSSANREEGCQKVGFIREELHSQVMQLCVPTRAQSTSHLASIVYQSSGSTVTLDMLAPHVLKKTTPFLIKYEEMIYS